MSEHDEVERLRQEIRELRQTVQTLREIINSLTHRLDTGAVQRESAKAGTYSVSSSIDKCLQDASWGRLLNLLERADAGLTAAELARRWGKSRSRTSEVLNRLVAEGRVVKYRDGRRIRFRALDTD